MRLLRALVPLVVPVLVGGCVARRSVELVVNPEARLDGRQTVRILIVPECEVRVRSRKDDPMRHDSPSNRAIRDALRQGFEERGYQALESGASLDVAYYASVSDQLDVRLWNYGYQREPRWLAPVDRSSDLAAYPAGTVIVDVIDPYTRELLWRGSALARLSSDSDGNLSALRSAVAAIVERFPPARLRLVSHQR
jgi:hypothetical protein